MGIKIWQFTDLHLHVREDKAQLDPRPNQTALPQSEEIIDACLAAFLAEPGCDTLLLTGDLTQVGHPEEHQGMIAKLRRVQEAGKRVIAITASHDYKTIGKENCSQLLEMYAEFGLNDAIAKYEGGWAYVVQLAPGIHPNESADSPGTPGLRLLCINDHGRGPEPPWLPWALEQIGQARAQGERIFGMTHLPSLTPSPVYSLIEPRAVLAEGHPETVRALADAGLPFMLTGHSHIHNISPIITPQGSPYRDINTSALVGWPGRFRQIEIEDDSVHVTSREIPHIPAFGSLSTSDFLQRTFDVVLNNMFDGWDHDYDLFARSIGTGINPAPVYKMKPLLRPLGKIVCHISLGGLGRLLACGRSIPKEVRGLSLRDTVLEAMRNIYAGEEYYGPDTDLGKAFIAYGRRLRFLGKKFGVEDFSSFLLSLVYDETPDDEAEFEFG